MGSTFGDGGAQAAENAALDQRDAARDVYARLNRGLQTAGQTVNRATVRGLASLDKDIANQERNLARQEALIAEIDPTIVEASQQALRLLRGETSSTLAPLQRQRDMQRQKLLNSLREQLGPGAETSTAGIQALTRFDAETDSLFAGAQQDAISRLGSVAGQFNSTRPDIFGNIMGLSQLGQGKTNLLLGQGNFQTQRANTLYEAGMRSIAGTEGAQYVGDVARGQRQAAFGDQLLGAGLTIGTGVATNYLSGGAKKDGAKP